MNITENITRLKASLPADVTLVAVSKFHPVEALQEAYNAGQRVFGESRAQELTAKQYCPVTSNGILSAHCKATR